MRGALEASLPRGAGAGGIHAGDGRLPVAVAAQVGHRRAARAVLPGCRIAGRRTAVPRLLAEVRAAAVAGLPPDVVVVVARQIMLCVPQRVPRPRVVIRLPIETPREPRRGVVVGAADIS